MSAVLFGKMEAARLLLIVPIAFLLVLVIIVDNAFYRALAVAGLVVIEIFRDAYSLSDVASSVAEASRLPRRRRRRLRA